MLRPGRAGAQGVQPNAGDPAADAVDRAAIAGARGQLAEISAGIVAGEWVGVGCHALMLFDPPADLCKPHDASRAPPARRWIDNRLAAFA